MANQKSINATVTTPGMATPKELFARLSGLGISINTVSHAPVFTVHQNQKIRGRLPGAHCKTLFLQDKNGSLWLCVVMENKRVNMHTLANLIGSKRLSFAKPSLVRSLLGVEPGAVTPFALINDKKKINVVLDAELMLWDTANFHPLVNDKTTAIAPHNLLKFIKSCGNLPKIIQLTSNTNDTC